MINISNNNKVYSFLHNHNIKVYWLIHSFINRMILTAYQPVYIILLYVHFWFWVIVSSEGFLAHVPIE